MYEKGFCIGYNKRRRAIVYKDRKIFRLTQYILQELVMFIEFIYADMTKLRLFVIFRDSSHRIRNAIHAGREGKTTLAYSKNSCTNVVLG